MAEKLYGVLEICYRGYGHEKMMNELLWHVFTYKCSINPDDGFFLRSKCGLQSKREAILSAAGCRRTQAYDDKFSRCSYMYTHRFVVKEMEKTEHGPRLVISKSMLKQAVENVTRRFPHLVDKVRPELAQFIHKDTTISELQFI